MYLKTTFYRWEKMKFSEFSNFPKVTHLHDLTPKVRVFTSCCAVQFSGDWWVGWEISRWEWSFRCLWKWEGEEKGDNDKRNKALTTFHVRAVCALFTLLILLNERASFLRRQEVGTARTTTVRFLPSQHLTVQRRAKTPLDSSITSGALW